MTLVTTYDDASIEHLIERAAERGAGIYYEKTRHEIQLVLEAIDSMKVQIDKIPHIEEDMAQLKTEVKIIKKVVTDTNKDLRSHDKRITRLEKAVFHD